jgi:hypothetical protein
MMRVSARAATQDYPDPLRMAEVVKCRQRRERAAYPAGYRKDVEALPPPGARRPTLRTGGACRPHGQRTIQVATAGLCSSRSKRAHSADS